MVRFRENDNYLFDFVKTWDLMSRWTTNSYSVKILHIGARLFVTNLVTYLVGKSVNVL